METSRNGTYATNNKETESNHTTTKKSTTHNKNSRDKEMNKGTTKQSENG